MPLLSLSMSRNKVFVGNLDNDVNEMELRRAFCGCGQIIKLWVARDPPGFAFVEYENVKEAEQACKTMNGYCIRGKAVKVEFSTQRDKDQSKRTEREASEGYRIHSRNWDDDRNAIGRRSIDQHKESNSSRRDEHRNQERKSDQRKPSPRRKVHSRSRSRDRSPCRSHSPVRRNSKYSPMKRRAASPFDKKRDYFQNRREHDIRDPEGDLDVRELRNGRYKREEWRDSRHKLAHDDVRDAHHRHNRIDSTKSRTTMEKSPIHKHQRNFGDLGDE